MVDKSLARQVDSASGESRFMMLETIREYGLEKLAATEEEPLVRRTHAAYYLVLAEEGAEGADTERFEWRERLKVECDNIRAALRWLLETRDADWGLRFGAALFRFWEAGEHLSEGREFLRKLLALGDPQPTKIRARVLFAAGVLAGEQGDYAAGDLLIQDSLKICQELKDDAGTAVSLNALAVHARRRGDIAASRPLLEESVRLWRDSGDKVAIAKALSNLANVVKMQGDFSTARSLYEDSLSTFRELEDRTGIAWSLNHLGDIAALSGQPAHVQ
jgi:predicted ATPase